VAFFDLRPERAFPPPLARRFIIGRVDERIVGDRLAGNAQRVFEVHPIVIIALMHEISFDWSAPTRTSGTIRKRGARTVSALQV
jgi:hypothetical protein